MKAAMKFAGEPERGGDTYPWENFTAKEIETYLSFYDIQGLNKSPQLSYNFKSQMKDPLQGNDLIHILL